MAVTSRESLKAVLAKNMVARLGTLPFTTVAGLLSIAIAIRTIGGTKYGAVGLVSTLVLLFVPITDLGRGAVVTNAFSSRGTQASDRAAAAQLNQSTRFLAGVGALLAGIAAMLSLSNAWGTLLGEGASRLGHLNLTMGIVGLLIGLSVPLGMGSKILLGLGKNQVATLLTTIAPIVGLSLTALAALTKLPPFVFAIALPFGYFAQVAVMTVVGFRLAGLTLGEVAGVAANEADLAATRATGRPMLIIMVGLPIAMQSDRIVLSHASPGSLPQYSIVAQLYTPLYSVLATAGIALWPFFLQRRLLGGAVKSWVGASGVLGALGLVEGLGLVVIGKSLAGLLGAHRVTPSLSLLVAFGALLAMQGLQQAAGMYLTRPSELRIQAIYSAIMVPLNLGLSFILARELGAPGPIIGTLICLFLVQWAPLLPLILRDRSRGLADV